VTKHFYFGLDGARGIAALAVVLFHRAAWTGLPSLAHNAYLAVDLFFMLSGFVVAKAYANRIVEGMSFTEFAAVRLIRLVPMHAVGIALGTLALLAGIAAKKVESDFGSIAVGAVTGLLFIPLPVEILASPHIPPIFPINGPVWSLFYELLANAALFFALPFATRRRVLAVVVVSFVALVLTSWKYGSLHLGWAPGNFLGAVPRTVFGFAMGMLFYVYPRPSGGASFWKILIALAFIALVLAIPHPRANILDPFVVLTLMGAGWVLIAWQPQVGMLAKLCSFLGAMSYPIYVLHMPIFFLTRYLTLLVAEAEPGRISWLIATAVTLVGSWLLLKHFDEPFRKRLSSRLKTYRAGGSGIKSSLDAKA
jgi:peptidoglycan/LPS O-acetylase OafA/YrhL